MASANGSSVIHRKARAAREEFDARAMSPAKALRLSLELCGDELFDMALTVCAVEQRALPHAGLRAEVPEGHLLLLLDGPEGGRGALLIDRQFAQALVEVQTMGRVSPGEAPPRPLTATDASVSAPLIDAMLRAFADRLERLAPGAGPGIYRFGDRLEDARALALALTAQDFELFRLTVDIARGAKTGVLTLILPAPLLRPPEPEPDVATGRFDLAQVAMDASVTLDAVLHRLRLPLREVCALRPGQLIPVPATAITGAELTAARGHVVAQVRLGQLNGARAVRLRGAPAEAGDGAGDGPDEAGPRPRPAEERGPRGLPGAGSGARETAGDIVPPAGLPAQPEEAGLPGLGDLGPGDLGLESAGAEAGAAPDLPGLADLPGLPDLNGADAASGPPAGGLPELPDLPDLPGLPDLPSV
ncbi:MAG: FliM/FliN family flagellar motor switch protein [Roseovarius sp.]